MTCTLALNGGIPQRQTLLPYGRQSIGSDDIEAVTKALQSDWLTTGPMVERFEKVFAEFVGATEAVAVSNGTAALHASLYAIGIDQGDEVIVPSMTFAATANAVVFCGGTPVFADVEPDTLLISSKDAEQKITGRTRAIVAVDYAGQPCEYEQLKALAARYKLHLIADACHSLGGAYGDQPVGALADLNCFSFHPVKLMTTGEGGMITTNNEEWARRMRRFRSHCLTSDHRERQEKGNWFYEQTDLGYNYRLTDVQCALGLSQLGKISGWIKRRQVIAKHYDEAFARLVGISSLAILPYASHAYHLYVVQCDPARLSINRDVVYRALRAENIGCNVHYIPVHLHPYYRQTFGTKPGQCPVAEASYERILSLPVFSAMSDQDVQDVIAATEKVCNFYRK